MSENKYIQYIDKIVLFLKQDESSHIISSLLYAIFVQFIIFFVYLSFTSQKQIGVSEFIDLLFFLLVPWVVCIFFTYTILIISGKKHINGGSLKSNYESKPLKFATTGQRFGAFMINYLLNGMIIPIPFNIYYYFKDGQTLGFKILNICIFTYDDGGVITAPSKKQLLILWCIRVFTTIATILGGPLVMIFSKKKQTIYNLESLRFVKLQKFSIPLMWIQFHLENSWSQWLTR